MSVNQRPVELLQKLIRFDTTNPPGNERECIGYINELLQQAGFETTILAKDPSRPNILARLKGRGNASGLLLQGHVDVVTTEDQQWTHPPFSGLEQDGYIWGRGALDMKSGVAMMVAAFLRLANAETPPNSDITLCIVSDEEAGGVYGARYLVEEHPEQFAGIRHSIGEFGGFPIWIGGQKFYSIQVAEKLQCTLRLTVKGLGGHGSQPVVGGAMAGLAKLLTDLDQKRTPVHITPVTERMIRSIADATAPPVSLVLEQLLQPSLTDQTLNALGSRFQGLTAIFRNTLSPTIVRGGSKVNVIPSRITVDVDGRMLPGFTPDQFVTEVRTLIGDGVELDILYYDQPASQPIDMTHFAFFAGILSELDPDGVPVPFMQPGVTDARFFGRLGIQNYGFVPMLLPEDFDFNATIHAADERIPVEALDFGTQAIYTALQRWGTE